MGGVCGGEYYTSKLRWSCGKIYIPGGPSSGLKGSILFLEIVHFSGMNKKQRSCDGWWGAQRPVRRGNEPKKTGARSAPARTRGQNPIVVDNLLRMMGIALQW
jgi:hypothetical protein